MVDAITRNLLYQSPTQDASRSGRVADPLVKDVLADFCAGNTAVSQSTILQNEETRALLSSGDSPSPRCRGLSGRPA